MVWNKVQTARKLSRHRPRFTRQLLRFSAITLVQQSQLNYDIPCNCKHFSRALPATEDDLSIFQVRTWTQYSKLGSVRLLRFFDMSLCCRDMTEDDLSIF